MLKSNFLKSSHCDLRCINIDKCNDKKTQCSWRPFPHLVIPGENSWPYHRNPGMSWSFWHRKGQHECVPQEQQSPPCLWDLHFQRQPHSHTWGGLLIGIIYSSHFFSSKLGDSTGCLTATEGFCLNALELICLIGVSCVNGQARRQPVIWIFFGSGRG